jgi:hypothetical protein
MRIEQLGELSPDERIPEWLVSEKVDVPYFAGAQLRFVFDCLEGDDRPDELASAVRRFLGLTIRDRDNAAPYVFMNYREMCEAIGDNEVGVKIDKPADVWNHVHPNEIHVTRRPYGDCKVYVQITAECAWEPEHGLQIVYREGSELIRVSQQDGHLTHVDAYALPESEDRIA